MTTNLVIPYEVAYVLWKTQQKGFEAYLVGGAVRDILLHSLQISKENQNNIFAQFNEVSDYDFASNATPRQIQSIFPDSFYTNEFGTVGIVYDKLISQMRAAGFNLPRENIATRTANLQPKGKNRIIDLATATKIHPSLVQQVQNSQESQPIDDAIKPPPLEVTTYRSEGLYSDYRRPDEISWGSSIDEDLERRDFTVNALALKIEQSALDKIFSQSIIEQSLLVFSTNEYTLVDNHQGLKDLANKIICTVRNPDERFEEDALRMLRAIRLSCQLSFSIEELTLASIKTHASLIRKISWERIQIEFLKIISSDQPSFGIKLLDQTGLLSFILPELQETKNVEQGGHHDTDVWTHSLSALEHCPSPDPIVRLAALLHDIGKPKTYQLRNGNITFYNHEIVSSRLADKIAKRLKLSNSQRTKLFKLVRYHMFHYQPHDTDAAIRRFIKRVGLDYIDDILDLREGDRLGSGARKTSWRLEELKERIVEQLNQPFDTTDLAINGNDLIGELELKPGPIIGTILDQLLEQVLENPELNSREKLFKRAKKIINNLNLSK